MNSLRRWKQLELNLGPVADMPRDHSSEEFIATHLSESPTGQVRLMESICERNNMKRAVRRVVRNKGAPGIDGMTVRQVKRRLKRHWPKMKQALLEIFSNTDLPDGQRGFFHPDNYTFEQPVYLSQIVALAMQVPGVLWIDSIEKPPHRFKRWGQPSRKELEEGMITFNRLEIVRLDNDPNFPENGKIEFFMKGGL